ncbi:response regulator [Thermoactinospora rubra]|uniref:response regulator n=1 Tax=Thermoactinospora rubra TaxID=1088767 RepID=UPI000A119186|nr:response regulator transcription factor [Thermoactinospora rubra]
MIRVVVADDERLVCAHLRTILEADGEVEVVAEAHDGAEAVEAAVRHRPDVLLLDLRMPGVDGLTAMEHLARLPKPPAVVVLTAFDTDANVLRAMRMGATGFLLKDTPPDDLLALVRVAARGATVMSPSAAARLVGDSGERQAARERVSRLSEREHEILALIAEGASNAEIAKRLFLTEGTVKGYVSRLLDKLGCGNRTQAAHLAFKAGIRRRSG